MVVSLTNYCKVSNFFHFLAVVIFFFWLFINVGFGVNVFQFSLYIESMAMGEV
jgi:hypothetical protein